MNEKIWQKPSLQPFKFFLLSILIGVVAGLAAVAFRGLIAFFHNLLFLGKLYVVYDANVHTPTSPWGLWVIFVPVIGVIGVTFLIQNFAAEAKGVWGAGGNGWNLLSQRDHSTCGGSKVTDVMALRIRL